MEELLWLENMFRTKYEIKAEYVGPDGVSKQEMRILNRVIRWTGSGITYEPDQRHAELIIAAMGMENSKPVSTPGNAESKDEQLPRPRQA